MQHPRKTNTGDCRHGGVVHIADDLIVHGKTVVEHAQNLHKLLARLEEKNLTLNSEKCTFGMSKVVFMGILLSRHDIGPTEEKVRAVKEAVHFHSQNTLCGLSGEHCGSPVPASKGYVQDEEYVCEVTLQEVPVALHIEEIEEVSYQDEELTAVREALKTGNWRQAPKAYELVCNELTYVGQVVLRGTRIVVAKKLQRRVLDLAHEGQQGIVKTKERIRSKVW